MNIKWTDKITNKELWRITKQKPIEIQIKRRKWNWIGHTLRKEAGATEKTALDRNPQGYRRRGRAKRMWRRTIEDEIRNTGRSWNEVKGIAGDRWRRTIEDEIRNTGRSWNEVKGIDGDRNAWELLIDALCSMSKRTR